MTGSNSVADVISSLDQMNATEPNMREREQVMSVEENVVAVMTLPDPAGLWQLRSSLLVQGQPADAPIMRVIDRFFYFLSELVASSTAREYSQFASMLDIAAVAGVALQNLLDKDRGENWWARLLLGAFSEGLMLLASRQYIKAWEQEMSATYSEAAWHLFQEYWELSVEMQPDLPAIERRQLVDKLIEPAMDDRVSGTVRAALLARLFQLDLLARWQALHGS